MMALHIQAERLAKAYDLGQGVAPKMALDGVSLNIAEGERVGLIGRNGAGKTTLLQLVSGIAQPTGGRLDVQGQVTAIFTLGMGLRDDLTGRQNIEVEGELLGRTREQTAALADDIINFAELGEFIDRPVRTYSTGMKARLAFSTIVHIEPEILIVDEALSVGDARFSEKATAKMRELAARGRILILVSHSMRAIQEMCTRCIWMDEGRVRMDGPPAQVTQAYLDEVHRADEALLLERFRREVTDVSVREGFRVESLDMLGHEGIAALSLQTGEPAAVAVRLTAPAGLPVHVRLRVERLDALDVLDSGMDLEPGAAGQRELRVDLGYLPLNAGVFKLRIDLECDGRPAATRSTVFEVLNPNPLKGGRPILVVPARCDITPLAP
ncbi:ABC transporter ATP-binding protein [Ramlibacter tataouinensis]|uniref:ABC transporter ATP-binding protein n=1 Tax=Ramlibacter tataouinensis TaxID=94132 RepID=UPI0022F3E618|nr:ABC transporter ATP-binding protein [Ramlibacter tataouinensis]WBY00715.1 ABC transporter ATP-binding protein [Ramlibacter tataouinensis]